MVYKFSSWIQIPSCLEMRRFQNQQGILLINMLLCIFFICGCLWVSGGWAAPTGHYSSCLESPSDQGGVGVDNFQPPGPLPILPSSNGNGGHQWMSARARWEMQLCTWPASLVNGAYLNDPLFPLFKKSVVEVQEVQEVYRGCLMCQLLPWLHISLIESIFSFKNNFLVNLYNMKSH